MIDEATFELLSRHLDGDLPPSQARQLEARLAAEPALAVELQALAQLRSGLALLAEREQPPAALDAALEPLRRSPAPVPQLRPAYRWLALAATLVVGATVTLQVARRTAPAPVPATAPRLALPDPRATPYQLRPLPTSSVPVGEEPLGVSERLLARPLPTPPLPELPPHVAAGPLTEAERALTGPAPLAPRPARQVPSRPDDAAAPVTALRERAVDDDEAAVAVAGAAPSRAQKAVADHAPAVDRRRQDRPAEEAARPATVTLHTAAGVVAVGFETLSVQHPGHFVGRVAVRHGVVTTALAGPARPGHTPAPALLLDELSGLPVGAVADGDYEVTIAVE